MSRREKATKEREREEKTTNRIYIMGCHTLHPHPLQYKIILFVPVLLIEIINILIECM
jgi:hypothetical protein